MTVRNAASGGVTCKRGHALDAASVIVYKNGKSKECRICRRERDKAAHIRWRLTGHGKEAQKRYRQSEKGKAASRYRGRTHWLKKYYGLTRQAFDELVNQQHGTCAICEKQAKLFVDHDHVTGKVRGLLCNMCNRALGGFYDDPKRLHRAAEYIGK